MKNLPKISEAEWRVMKVFWQESPLTAKKVVERLSDQAEWNPKTIRTLINRLVQKEALAYDQEGRSYLYYPVVEESACAHEESRSFLRRVYGGTLKPMLASFLEEEDLSAEEIEELKQMLDERGAQS